MKRNLLLTPGPTVVPPELCAVLGRPIIHHRTPQFQQYLKEAIEGLQYVLQTQNDVYIMASSGTGAMEASVCSLLSPCDQVITVEGGKFGERWTELAKVFQAEPIPMNVEWGKAVQASDIQLLLKQHPSVKAVFTTSCETSTGVAPDIKAIADIVKGTGAVLVVDAISSFGVMDLKMDEWGVDVVVSASHKGLMLPPGVSFIAMSEKAKALMAQSTTPKFYFDLRKYAKISSKPDTPFTPAIGIIIALVESLRRFREQGLDYIFAHYAYLASGLRAAVAALGLNIFTEESARANVLTAVEVPEGIDGNELVRLMRDTYGVTVAGGQGDFKGKIIRMAHMGCLVEADILEGIVCLEKALNDLGYQCELGKGVAAAQAYFNKG